MRSVYVLNKTNHDRSGIVVCGFPFDKGEVTSLNQIITVSQANGLGSDPTFTQKVQWEPYGANHEDGSYRYGKIAFRADVAANSERRAIVNPAGGSYTSVPYDPAVYNMFRGIRFYFSMNGQEVELDFSQLALISTGGSDCHYRRYRHFSRPFPSMQWIWVEVVFDVPSLSLYGTTQNVLSTTPIEHVNFWFRYGCSHISRNGGQSIGQYAYQQRHHFLNDYAALVIAGCDSIFRFEEHIYDKLNLNSFPSNYPTTNGYLYVLENPNYDLGRNTNQMKYGTCKNHRGCLILGNNQTSTILAERQEELTAIAEGWNKYVPPAFTEVPLPPNINANDRADQCNRIDNMMFRRNNTDENLARRQPMPYPVGPYGLRPFAPGGGNQGVEGNAFHHNPLYYTMSAAYSRELPYIIHSTELWGQRPQWLYEDDGTIFKVQNYPTALMWSSEVHPYSPDWLGMHEYSWPAQAARGYRPNEEWAGLDRQHCSSQQEALAAIITADYFMLDCFAQTWAEMFAACLPLYFRDNITVDSWEADRASARMLQTSVTLYYATGSDDLLKGIIRRYWLGNAIKQSWEYGNPGGIEKLKFIDTPNSWNDGNRNYYMPGRVDQPGNVYQPAVGELFVFAPGVNPWYTPWQLCFVAAAYVAVQRLFEDLFPNGAYMLGYTITKLTGPNQAIAPGSIPIFDSIPRNLAWDLAGSLVLHNTFYIGPGSEYNWARFEVTVTPGNGLLSNTVERKIQCYPVGATFRGVSSNTTGIICRLEGGAYPGGATLGNTPVTIFIKNVTGPGYNTVGTVLTEHFEVIVNNQVIYSSTEFQSGSNVITAYTKFGWYGTVAYCFDKFGLGRNSQYYRKPLTRQDLEETDPVCRWNIYTQEGPKWLQIDPNYGIWHTVAASIALEGLRNNYYTSNDPAYPVSALYNKAKLIANNFLSYSSIDNGEWDRLTWPFMGIYRDFLDTGNAVKIVSVLDSTSQIPTPQVQTDNLRSVTIGSKEDSQVLEARSIVFPFAIYAVTPTNVTVAPKAVGDTMYKEAVQTFSIDRGWEVTITQEIQDNAVIPGVLVATTFNRVGPKINAIINLSIDGPKQSTTSIQELPVAQSEVPTLPTNEPRLTIDNLSLEPQYPYTVNPTVI